MGDVQNAAERVRKLARALQFPHLRAMRLERGGVQDLLRLLHWALLDSSRALAAFLLARGFDLYGKTDARFVESLFRLLRDEFRVFPALSAAQFLSTHFVERRLLLTADVLALVLRKRAELQRQRRQQDAVWSPPAEARATAASVDNHVLPPELVDHAAVLLERLNGLRRERGDSASGRRVRVSRVRLRDARAAASRDASGRSVLGEDKAADTERAGADDRPEAQRDREASSGGSEGREEQGGRRAEESSERAADSHSPPLAPAECSCSRQQPNVEQALAAITQQLADLSDTLASKISAVEGRLDALETRVSGLHASVSELQHAHPQERPSRDAGGTRTSGGDAFEKRQARENGSCAWPPSPAMFDRY